MNPVFGALHDEKLFTLWLKPIEPTNEWYLDPDIEVESMAKTPNTLNKGGRIARASVIAKLRRMKRSDDIDSVEECLDRLIEWVNFSASRYKKRPGGLR